MKGNCCTEENVLAKVVKADEMNKCLGCFACMLVCASINRKNHSIRKSAIHVRTSGGMQGRFIAALCHACQIPRCAEVCPCGALDIRKGGGVLLDEHKCIGCRRCQKVCVVMAIGYDEDARKPIICNHCGLCAKYCPHDCLTVVNIRD